MSILHKCLTLRGNVVMPGIVFEKGITPFVPTWGINNRSQKLLAATSDFSYINLHNVEVCLTQHGAVLVSADGTPTRELILIQQYQTGTGAKRWPGFSVELDENVRLLSETATSGGSGSEKWSIISAPLGWAHNIAYQFVNEKDEPSQTIRFVAASLESSREPLTAMQLAMIRARQRGGKKHK